MGKSYGELEKMHGGSVKLPAADAPEEEKRAFYTKMGVPESPDKYELKFPDGTRVDDTFLGSFRTQAHQLGITPAQAQGLAAWWTEQNQGMEQGQEAASVAQRDKWTSELKNELGYTYNRTISQASQILATILEGDQNHEMIGLLNKTGLGDNPTLIKFMASLHDPAVLQRLLQEDKFLDQPAAPSEDDISNAQEEKAKILHDMKHPYWKGDPSSVARMVRLNEVIAAGSSA